MQAIEVKWIAPTNKRDIRYKAICAAKQMTFNQTQLDYEISSLGLSYGQDERARQAATLLARSLGWNTAYYGEMIMGGLKNGNWVFVFRGKEDCNVIK